MLSVIISFLCIVVVVIFIPSLIISTTSIVIAHQNSNVTCGDSFMTLQTWLYTSATVSLIICGSSLLCIIIIITISCTTRNQQELKIIMVSIMTLDLED